MDIVVFTSSEMLQKRTKLFFGECNDVYLFTKETNAEIEIGLFSMSLSISGYAAKCSIAFLGSFVEIAVHITYGFSHTTKTSEWYSSSKYLLDFFKYVVTSLLLLHKGYHTSGFSSALFNSPSALSISDCDFSPNPFRSNFPFFSNFFYILKNRFRIF